MPDESKLIHVGYIVTAKGNELLFLRQQTPHLFRWFYVDKDYNETQSEVLGENVEEAMRFAWKSWKNNYFRTIICGFRYTLPERDEHGMNALFHQMAASLSVFNGIYFDEEVGHTCYVQNASIEAQNLWRTLKRIGKL